MLITKVGSFTKTVAAAPAVQAVAGVAFQPKALILWSNAGVGGIESPYYFGLGFSDGSNSRSVTCQDLPAATKRDALSALALPFIQEGIPSTADSECILTSFDADGFTLNWVTNDPTPAIIHYLALGGIELSGVRVGSFGSVSGLGLKSVVGVGFQPDAVLFMSIAATDSPPRPIGAGGMELILGAAVSDSQRGSCVGWSQLNGSSRLRRQRTDRCLVGQLTGAFGAAEFVSMDADGFTLDWVDEPGFDISRVCYMALQGGRYSVGNETQATVPGQKATVGVGFQPNGLFLFGDNYIADSGNVGANIISVGAASGPGVEGCVWVGRFDRSTQTNKVLRHIDTDAPIGPDAEADLLSFDPDGFTLDWTTADAVARQFLYLALGSMFPPQTTMPGRHTLNIYKGADLDTALTYKDSAQNPVNLAGYTARLQVRASVDAAAFLLELTTTLVAGSGIVLGGAAGTIRLVAPAAATAAYTWDDGVYDLELVNSAGIVTRLLEGPAKAWDEATR